MEETTTKLDQRSDKQRAPKQQYKNWTDLLKHPAFQLFEKVDLICWLFHTTKNQPFTNDCKILVDKYFDVMKNQNYEFFFDIFFKLDSSIIKKTFTSNAENKPFFLNESKKLYNDFFTQFNGNDLILPCFFYPFSNNVNANMTILISSSPTKSFGHPNNLVFFSQPMFMCIRITYHLECIFQIYSVSDGVLQCYEENYLKIRKLSDGFNQTDLVNLIDKCIKRDKVVEKYQDQLKKLEDNMNNFMNQLFIISSINFTRSQNCSGLIQNKQYSGIEYLKGLFPDFKSNNPKLPDPFAPFSFKVMLIQCSKVYLLNSLPSANKRLANVGKQPQQENTTTSSTALVNVMQIIPFADNVIDNKRYDQPHKSNNYWPIIPHDSYIPGRDNNNKESRKRSYESEKNSPIHNNKKRRTENSYDNLSPPRKTDHYCSITQQQEEYMGIMKDYLKDIRTQNQNMYELMKDLVETLRSRK